MPVMRSLLDFVLGVIGLAVSGLVAGAAGVLVFGNGWALLLIAVPVFALSLAGCVQFYELFPRRHSTR